MEKMIVCLLVVFLIVGCSHKYTRESSTAEDVTSESGYFLPPNPDRDPGPVPPAVDLTGAGGGFVPIYFDFDRYNIRDDQQYNMEYNARFVTGGFVLEGYCDERGTIEYNLALGMRRAESARKHLIKYNYVRPETIVSTVSYGKLRPVDPAHNEDAWAKNRRVEFRLR